MGPEWEEVTVLWDESRGRCGGGEEGEDSARRTEGTGIVIGINSRMGVTDGLFSLISMEKLE